MSLIAIVIIIICIVIYIAADISRKNQLQQATPASHLRKKNQYLLESQILTQMAKQKNTELETKSKPKLCMHINTKQSLNNLSKITALTKKYKVYVVLNVNQQQLQFNQEVNKLVQSTQIFKCKTIEGEIAIIRQLNPKIHIETDERIIKALKPFLNLILTTYSVAEGIEESKNVRREQNVDDLLMLASEIKI